MKSIKQISTRQQMMTEQVTWQKRVTGWPLSLAGGALAAGESGNRQ